MMFVATLGVSSSPAGAALAWVCPKGSVCFYYDGAGTKLACQTPSNGSPKCDGAHIWAIYNRGWEDPGHDHAYVSGYMVGSNTYTTGCIHLGHKGALQRAVKFNWVIWSGECGTVGDYWEL
ncbi:hypothetical protein GCM10020219_080630 [Nonomuraea dietziae]